MVGNGLMKPLARIYGVFSLNYSVLQGLCKVGWEFPYLVSICRIVEPAQGFQNIPEWHNLVEDWWRYSRNECFLQCATLCKFRQKSAQAREKRPGTWWRWWWTHNGRPYPIGKGIDGPSIALLGCIWAYSSASPSLLGLSVLYIKYLYICRVLTSNIIA